MILKPRHLAAVQYSVIGGFLLASWYLLLSPPGSALGQLELIFSGGYEKRTFFILFAITTSATLLLAVMYWFARSESAPLSRILPLVSIGVFSLALWQFDATLILGFGLGCCFALWTWYAPDTVLHGGCADKRRHR